MVLIKNLKPGQTAKISGKVVRVTDEDEFILRDQSGSISVDANLDDRFLNISKGDRVIVRGRRDNDDFEFDAFRIQRKDGKRILSSDRSFDVDDQLDDDRFGDERFDDDWFDDDRFEDDWFEDGQFDDDVILGTNKRDVLTGTNDEDIFIGKGGKDVLTGGGDNDLFVYEKIKDGGDRIKDFSPVADALDLRSIFDRTNYSSPTPLEEYLEFQQRGSKTQVRIDPDGDAGSKGLQTLVTLNGVAANDLSSSNILV